MTSNALRIACEELQHCAPEKKRDGNYISYVRSSSRESAAVSSIQSTKYIKHISLPINQSWP